MLPGLSRGLWGPLYKVPPIGIFFFLTLRIAFFGRVIPDRTSAFSVSAIERQLRCVLPNVFSGTVLIETGLFIGRGIFLIEIIS